MTYIDCDDAPVLFTAICNCTGSYLNIRAERDKGSNSIGKIPRGEYVDVLDASDASWWRVKYKGVVGYSMTEYLKRKDVELSDNDDSVTLTLDRATAEKLYNILERSIKA